MTPDRPASGRPAAKDFTRPPKGHEPLKRLLDRSQDVCLSRAVVLALDELGNPVPGKFR